MECLARERVKSQNIIARFNERVIGLTNDLITFAPSLQANKATAGSIRPPVIDRVFPFAQAQGALAYLEKGRAKGKVVVQIVMT